MGDLYRLKFIIMIMRQISQACGAVMYHVHMTVRNVVLM